MRQLKPEQVNKFTPTSITNSNAAQLFIKVIQNSIRIYDEIRTLKILYICCESAIIKE